MSICSNASKPESAYNDHIWTRLDESEGIMPHHSSSQFTPTITDIDRITAIADPVLRNLHITQSYHELARVMSARTGLSANWCTFATWASKQAGQTIRKEDFLRTLEEALVVAQDVPEAARLKAFGVSRPAPEIQETLAEVLNPLAALDRASAAVAAGNKKVYEEIGREFARFITTCLDDQSPNQDNLSAFCAGLRAGEPPDGQDFLRRAFTAYYRALFEPDAKTRAELMLCANIQIGFHEQTRLQPEITGAMNAAFIDPSQYRRRLIRALFPYHGLFVRLRLWLLKRLDRPSPLDALLNQWYAAAQQQVRFIVTRCVMTIGLPDGVRLRLGTDLPADYPPLLESLTLPDLCALLDQITPANTPRQSAAVDWSRLPDRLRFIADMFRCYHERADLFAPPFTAAQVAAIKANRLPHDPL